MNQLFQTLGLMVLTAFCGLTAQAASETLSRQEAIDYMSVGKDDLQKRLVAKGLEIRDLKNGYYELLVCESHTFNDETLRECLESDVVRKAGGKLVGYFDEEAERLLPRKPVVVIRTSHRSEEPPVFTVDYKEDVERSYAVKINDKKVLGETLRSILGYSRELIVGVSLAEEKNPVATGPLWGEAYILKRNQASRREDFHLVAAKIQITGYMQRSPEIFDGLVVELLKNPSDIPKTPFSEANGTVPFAAWATWADTLLAEDAAGELRPVANRVKTALPIPMGFFNRDHKIQYVK